jgi:hypothetical protein
VTAGYASTLLARSRGRAPLLLPSTPSRFETDAHPADLLHDVTVDRQPEASAGHQQDAAVLQRAPAPVDRGAEGPPLPGWGTTATSPVRDEFLSTPTHPTAPTRHADELLMPDWRPSGHDGTPVALARATPAPAHLDEHVVAVTRVDRDDRSAARFTAAPGEANEEPPIVVRIGRLDVRAVQAPPVRPPQPRPRPAATPTLEERLAARDRQ